MAPLFDAKTISIAAPLDEGILKSLTKVRGLEQADAETVAVAKERGHRAVVDDLPARRVARTYGIDFVGTPYILFLAIQNRVLTKCTAKSLNFSQFRVGR